jgi:RTX calcium-binding nonapeptide repeat (4 copies)
VQPPVQNPQVYALDTIPAHIYYADVPYINAILAAEGMYLSDPALEPERFGHDITLSEANFQSTVSCDEPSGLFYPLTPQELDYLQDLLDAGDRGGFYLAYYNMTGREQALIEGRVTTFSGVYGGSAYAANVFLAASEPRYQISVYAFSQLVAQSMYDFIEYDVVQAHGTGDLCDARLRESATQAWVDQGMADVFPGNFLDILKNQAQLSEAGTEAWIFALEGAATVIEGIDKTVLDQTVELRTLVQQMRNFAREIEPTTSVYSKGTGVALLGGLVNGVFGKVYEDYEGRAGYTYHKTPDDEVGFFIDNSTGRVVFIEETGSVDNVVGDIAENAFISGILQLALSVQYDLSDFRVTLSEGKGREGRGGDPLAPVGGIQHPVNTRTTFTNGFGDDGDNTIFGTRDKDLLFGRAGDDVMFTGAEWDAIRGDDGNDILWGGEGDDQYEAGDGDDIMRDVQGDDEYDDGPGNDLVLDSQGYDTYHFTPRYEELHIRDGDGQGLLIWSGTYFADSNFQQTIAPADPSDPTTFVLSVRDRVFTLHLESATEAGTNGAQQLVITEQRERPSNRIIIENFQPGQFGITLVSEITQESRVENLRAAYIANPEDYYVETPIIVTSGNDIIEYTGYWHLPGEETLTSLGSVLHLLEGDDVVSPTRDREWIDGGPGNDTVAYSKGLVEVPVEIDLEAGYAIIGPRHSDTPLNFAILENFENIRIYENVRPDRDMLQYGEPTTVRGTPGDNVFDVMGAFIIDGRGGKDTVIHMSGISNVSNIGIDSEIYWENTLLADKFQRQGNGTYRLVLGIVSFTAEVTDSGLVITKKGVNGSITLVDYQPGYYGIVLDDETFLREGYPDLTETTTLDVPEDSSQILTNEISESVDEITVPSYLLPYIQEQNFDAFFYINGSRAFFGSRSLIKQLFIIDDIDPLDSSIVINTPDSRVIFHGYLIEGQYERRGQNSYQFQRYGQTFTLEHIPAETVRSNTFQGEVALYLYRDRVTEIIEKFADKTYRLCHEEDCIVLLGLEEGFLGITGLGEEVEQEPDASINVTARITLPLTSNQSAFLFFRDSSGKLTGERSSSVYTIIPSYLETYISSQQFESFAYINEYYDYPETFLNEVNIFESKTLYVIDDISIGLTIIRFTPDSRIVFHGFLIEGNFQAIGNNIFQARIGGQTFTLRKVEVSSMKPSGVFLSELHEVFEDDLIKRIKDNYGEYVYALTYNEDTIYLPGLESSMMGITFSEER